MLLDMETETETGGDSANAIALLKEFNSARFGVPVEVIVLSVIVDRTERPEEFAKGVLWIKESSNARDDWACGDRSVEITVRDAFVGRVELEVVLGLVVADCQEDEAALLLGAA